MKFSKKEEYLRRNDKKLKKVIDSNGHIKFKSKKDNQFDTIVGIIGILTSLSIIKPTTL